MSETSGIARAVERALAARERLARRPLAATIASLAAAAGRFAGDAELAHALPEPARLSPAMVAAVLPLAAGALDAGAMTALVERELGPGAAARPAPAGPALVAHVLASNVPALALPAIALGCLAGAAVLVKSGRHDRLSAPAFARALAAVDPELAATVIAAYWPGGDAAAEEGVLARADVVVASGGDAALAALRARLGARLVAYGPRLSVAAVACEDGAAVGSAATAGRADGAAAASDADRAAEALALDVALYEQRGCLSPHAVFVAGDARAFAERLAAALDRLAARLPPPDATVAERAARRLFRAEAECIPGATALGGAGGTVVVAPAVSLRPTCGLRSVWVHPVATLADVPALLPPGTVECVALGGGDAAALLPALRARGVARVCPPGRMQRPPLVWARGQRAPLGVLLGRSEPPRLEVEA